LTVEIAPGSKPGQPKNRLSSMPTARFGGPRTKIDR
jgi:hypothetical protein